MNSGFMVFMNLGWQSFIFYLHLYNDILLSTVQASFRLQKPVSVLVHHLQTLESDILGEIGVPNTMVSILSMHQSIASNCTNVVFGLLPIPKNVPINLVSLSLLRSSLVELVLGQTNLSLTTSIFGLPSFFQILMFPGGVTVVPGNFASIWQMPQTLFNFTLYNSVSQIQKNFGQFEDQLRFGLHLRSYENVYVQVTNENGSTLTPPVTVQASVLSDIGSRDLLPQRLKQLAETITGSPAKNLGLNYLVFGNVKEISLSSILNHTLRASQGSPSPAYAPAPSPGRHQLSPCLHCDTCSPSYNALIDAPVHEHCPQPPSVEKAPSPLVIPSCFPRHGPCGGLTIMPGPSPTADYDTSSPDLSPHAAFTHHTPLHSTPQLAPELSTTSTVFYGSSLGLHKRNEVSVPSSFVSSHISTSRSFCVSRPPPCKMWLMGLLHLIFLLWTVLKD
uniref:DUF7036 domain-containing protein n=1 Tax=Nelumbo nucifera TaxID=4432 RepID=A0A822XSI0_NELNU|nr:TPA_asm: hypothetical protein HUJ06_026028 [Nelumbo nucifera]